MEAFLSQAWREKSLVLLMADAVPQTERRTPRLSKTWWRMQSGSNQSPDTKFPVNRENTGNFFGIGVISRFCRPNEHAISDTYAQNSLHRQTGNFSERAGN